MNNTITIAGKEIQPGTIHEIKLKISEYYTANPVYIPVVVINGNEEGPRLFITAALHGDEINGIEIASQLITSINPETLNGVLICVPIINIFGFYTMSRSMPDRRDLNETFPGSPKGSPAARIAAILFEEVIQKCNYGIDIHTPRANRFEMPHIEADLNNREAHQLARAFGTPLIINAHGPEKSLQNTATSSGIPTIVYSGGEILRFDEKTTEQGVTGIHNVLSHLEMADFERKKPEFEIIVQKSRSLRTLTGGILYIHVKAGDLIYKGELVARVTHPFGKDTEHITAPETGLIISASTTPLVNPGNEVYSYVILDKSLGIVEDTYRKNGHPSLGRNNNIGTGNQS
jgi:hypothetical protein